MEQLNIFGNAAPAIKLPADLMGYFPGIFGKQESLALMQGFIKSVPWQQRTITMYNKVMVTPRLTAWYGDTGTDYTFSGSKFDPLPWTDELQRMREIVQGITGTVFNSVLLNFYRDGNDSVAWHSDDEYELGIKPVIASVSLGQERRFDVRSKTDRQQKYSIDLESGSVLLMKGDMQHNFEHRIAKSTTPMKERINLTFRVVHK